MLINSQNRFRRLASYVGIFVATSVTIARADAPPRPPAGHEIDAARARFADGVAAYKTGKYEEARLSFQQSYALRPAPPTLRNLAATELKTGRYLEAARHFTTYLKTTKPSEIDHREVVQKWLEEAKAHCAMLVVETNVAGVEIDVDGETLGRTPLSGDPWLVEPGEHVVKAHLSGYEDHSERQRLEVGRTTRISVALQPTGVPARVELPGDTTAPLPEKMARSPLNRAREPGAESAVSPASAASAHPSRAAVAPLAIGGTITLAGLALGIAYSVASNASERDHDALLANVPGPSPRCGSTTPYVSSCAEIAKLGDRADAQRSIATAGFVVAGAAGAATLTYWLWPRRSASQGSVVPLLSPNYVGVHWDSSF
jgi:tetratricopeptide (TPR) repeat protein